MVERVYLTNVSLDLSIEDEHDSLDRGAPSDEITAEFAGIWSAASWESFR